MLQVCDRTSQDEELPPDELAIVQQASDILKRRLFNVRYEIDSPDVAATYIRMKLGANNYESFGVISLNAQHEVIDDVIINVGDAISCSVDLRSVFKHLINSACSAAICYHNHPSGNSEPSQQDKYLTRALVNVGSCLGVTVVDHIIVSGKDFTSMAETDRRLFMPVDIRNT